MILPRAGSDRFRLRAMSLIELVTTVGVLAILFAMLLPTLGEVRREGKEVRCLSNLAQIADASAVYSAADRSETAIPVHPTLGQGPVSVAASGWGGKSGIGEPDISGPLDSLWGTKNGLGPTTRPLNEVLYADTFLDYQDNRGPGNANWISDTRLDLDVFRCPADYGYAGHHYVNWRDSKLTSFDHYGNSYTADVLWVGIPGGRCTLMSLGPFLRPLSRIPAPARTILYMENCGRFAWRINYGNENDGGCGSLSGDRGADVKPMVRAWHGPPFRFNVAFSDGHAAAAIMKGHQQPEPQLGRYPDFGDFQTNHSFWHCVILRGPDWQVDTLPAPAVQTEIPCSSSLPANGIE